MKFDIWTFLFQVINFIVLLFILKRILYRPVKEIIEKRRSLIQQSIDDAEALKKEALELKAAYQHEMDGVASIKLEMIRKLNEEIEEERKKLLDKAAEEAAEVLEKKRARFDVEKKRLEGELKDMTIEAVSIFATRLINDIANEDLHKALYARLFTELEQILSRVPRERAEDVPMTFDLITAYPLSGDETRKLRETIESLAARNVLLNVVVDKSLIAGVRITASDMVYDASLSQQIKTFAGTLRETV
jgi:F-type H+-transporting ATPase subunit b